MSLLHSQHKAERQSTLEDYFSVLESSFGAAWACASDAVVLADKDGKIIYANPAYQILYGFEEDETKGRYFDTLYQEKNQLTSLEKYKDLFYREEDNHLLESRILWADGCERVIETALHFIYQHGVRVAIVSVIRDITGKRIFQERKQLEYALIESERKFRAVFNQTFQFTGLLKSNGILLEANQTALDFAGITQTDIANKPFWEAPWWNHSQKIQQRLRSMVTEAAKGKLMRDEFEMVGMNKTIITVDFSLTPTKDETGKVVWLIAEARNISDRKRMEMQLRVNEEKYKALFQVFPVGITITDDKGKIIDVNPASERILGLSREEHTNRLVTEESWKIVDGQGNLIPPHLFPGYIALTERKLAKNDEMGVLKPDKSIAWLNVTATPIPLRGYGVAIAYVDVTQSKQNQEAIQESEARYRMLFDNTRYAILRTTPDFRILEANAEACRLFGYSPAEMAQNTQAYLMESNDSRIDEILTEIQQTGKFKGEVSLLKANGSKFIVELSLKVLLYENGNKEFCITIRLVK
ncbi:MAG: PAS domain-containing protein [Bacteroidota bacterium]